MTKIIRFIDLLGCDLFGRMFVGGYSAEEVLKKGARLKREGYNVTYNLLGEHIGDPVLIDYALKTTISLIDEMDSENKGNVAIKPSLYGLQISRDLFYKNAKRVLDHAKEAGVSVEFDAEQRRFLEDSFWVFNVFAERLEYCGFVRQCVQAHLKDILDLGDKYDLWNKRLRVVKGAGVYEEEDRICFKDSVDITRQYFEIIYRNKSRERYPFVATIRDKKLTDEITKTYPNPSDLEFEILYGPLGEKLGKFLLERGYSVRIYMPFVDTWCEHAWEDYGLRRSAMMRRLVWEEFKATIVKLLKAYFCIDMLEKKFAEEAEAKKEEL